MLALRAHAFDQPLQLDELPTPEPQPGEVRVRVQASGTSFFDMLIARGGYQWRPDLPFTVGSEFAGVVEALGQDANNKLDQGEPPLQPGDRVFGASSIGAWCQQLCVPAHALHRVARGATDRVAMDEAAVLSSPYGTALYGLRERGGIQAGDVVLVLGATGGVGLAAVQVARALGARVIGGASGPAKCAAVLEAGAHEALDLSQPDWKDRAKALAGPAGVNIVFDPVGGPAMDTAFRTLGWGGRLLVVGFAGGEIGSLRANLAIVKGASLVGVDLRQFREREPVAARRVFSDVARLHAQGALRPHIAQRFALTQHADAFALAQRRDTVGRVLLLP